MSIDGNSFTNLYKNLDIVTGEKNVTFIFDLNNEELLFNYYKTSLNLKDYQNMERNNNYNLNFISNNHTKMNLLPVYQNIN